MSDRPKRVETILFDGTLYRKDEIVTIRTSGTYGKEHTGRIACIDTLEFTLDMSEKYNHCIRGFKYEDLMYIKYSDTQGARS